MPDDNPPTETPDTADEQQQPDESTTEPHGDDDGTDWKAEARKWEKRAKENVEKAQAFDEYQEAQKTEAEKREEALAEAQSRAAAAERELLVLEVAGAKGLTPAQARRLTGDNREELEADADELLSLLSPPEQETPPPGGRPTRLHNGNQVDATPTEPTSAIADRIVGRR